ncbi:Alpha-L-fucosidase [Acidipropionibacterium jensenii]|uniref:alpha-L-fucosidase n=2 Tax=Acidipropionibacterium jensenii TaxID=1749 RepID=A0A3S4YWR2_9ACTN|nr:alpha-L-fucosidase [Acidipropionibacterium jensenii]VEI02948.1 Alpha-L-fucosidase [Acidipropionibacterium jensenii]
MCAVRPSPRQLAWQQLDFYGFLHFGMNTMTDREWGTGHEDPTRFDPDRLDADQWMDSLASAGMSGVILTAKHHDGFCLWPSRLTSHTVASSPWRSGHGDLVAETAAAAERAGLRFGIYLSPWDRTEASYGSGRRYDDFYLGQLTELLTGYGEIFEVWLDGACGEGPDGRTQRYDWDRYYATVRALQPGAVIAVCGPDVRWCGNEAGHTRPDEWSVVPGGLRDAERVAARSQTADDADFARRVRSDADDLGSRAALARLDAAGRHDELVWYPSEVDTSIRPGWFHHPDQDDQVLDADILFGLHRSATGGNATLLLNVPPDRHGLIAAPDRTALAGLGDRLADQRRRTIRGLRRCSSGGFQPDPADGVPIWRPDPADPRPTVTIGLDGPRRGPCGPGGPGGSGGQRGQRVEAVVLRERIAEGQRIEHVVVNGIRGESRTVLGECGTVGNRRILAVPPTVVDAVEIAITASRTTPAISEAAVILAP